MTTEPTGPAGHDAERWQLPVRSLLHLAQVAAVLAVVSLVPYLHESMADYRYWERLDAEPLIRAATFAAPVDAEAALAAGMPPAGADEELQGAALDQLAGVKPGGPEQAQVAQPAAHPAAGEPAAAAEGADDTADPAPAGPAPSGPAAAAAAALTIGDDVLGDQKVWLEGEPQALAPLYQALVDLAHGRRSHVRIAHYGDSHTANDGITHVTRKLLQRRFGDGGHGFALVQGRTQWYAHKGVKRSASAGWKLSNFLSGNARDGAYGYGGVAAEGGAGQSFALSATAQHPASRATLYFRSLGKATITAKLDGKSADTLKIDQPAGSDGSHTWTGVDGALDVAWRVTSGRVRVFGGALERDRGVVYDSLGEVGARGPRWLNADAGHLQQQMALRQPDLVILNYGGNEASDKVSESGYLERMGRVVERLRGGRQVACLVLGPGDHGRRRKGKIVSDPDVVRINDWQRKLALAQGCAFWDARAFMGGDGAMGRWVAKGLGWADYSHFTPKGEQAMGVATYRALLHGLRAYLQRGPGTTAAAPPAVRPAVP